MNFIKKIPLAVSGLALAVASLGNLLRPQEPVIYIICGVLSTGLMCLFFSKVIFDFANVKNDLNNPVIMSALPTSTMALMLLSGYAKPFIGVAALLLWYLAVAVHILIMLAFVKRFVLNFDIKNVFPTWFVAFVGIVAASVTSPVMNAIWLGQIIFGVGFTFYIIVFPVIAYRIIKLGQLPEPARPTIAIFTAPMNLCMVGYLSTFEEPNAMLIYTMLTISVLLYIYVTIKVLPLLKMKFYPTFAAMTFPYVINATAFNMVNQFLAERGHDFFGVAVIISQWVAIAVVLYVLIRYLLFFKTKQV